MGEKTGIKWTDHTFNSHMGCQRVSPACGGANPCGNCTDGSCFKVKLKAHHGADPSEWEEGLRLQEFPGVRP